MEIWGVLETMKPQPFIIMTLLIEEQEGAAQAAPGGMGYCHALHRRTSSLSSTRGETQLPLAADLGNFAIQPGVWKANLRQQTYAPAWGHRTFPLPQKLLLFFSGASLSPWEVTCHLFSSPEVSYGSSLTAAHGAALWGLRKSGGGEGGVLREITFYFSYCLQGAHFLLVF